jgi:hypothetical protein
MTTNGGKGKPPTKARQPKTSRKSTRFAACDGAWEKQTCQKEGKGKGGGREERGEMVFTECEDNVENFFVGQFRRDGIGGGGGSGGPGKLLGDNWDGHRGERDDDDQQIEAGPEERFGESSREEGHDLVVFEMKRVSYLTGLYRVMGKHTSNGRTFYTHPGPRALHLSSGRWHLGCVPGRVAPQKWRGFVRRPWTRTRATITPSSSEGGESGKLGRSGDDI